MFMPNVIKTAITTTNRRKRTSYKLSIKQRQYLSSLRRKNKITLPKYLADNTFDKFE